MKNVWKQIASKPMKYNKNADTLLLLRVNVKKILKKHLWVPVLKKVKNSGFWEYFTAISTES